MTAKKLKLVILSDYGLDDACALLYLLEHKERFSGIDVVAVGGNTDTETSLKNAEKLLGNYPGDKCGVRLIDTIDELQPSSYLPSIHGVDSMGDLVEPCKSGVEQLSWTAFLPTLSAAPFILFSLGPCTLTRRILEAFFPVQTILMAGLVDAEPNYEGMEFNQALDPDAYAACLRYPHVVATLDTCRDSAFNLAGKPREGKDMLSRFINRSRALAEARHPDNCFIYDYIAAQVLIRPEWFDRQMQVDKWGNTLCQLQVKQGFTF